MSELLLKFGKNEIIKKSFCKSMSPINVNKVDVKQNYNVEQSFI